LNTEPFDWREGNRIVEELGSEGHLAARITSEREAREWSQSELARQMKKVNCPIPQTAISKIEKPQTGGRRAITVEEALAFAKVFGIPFGELLLPVDQFKSMSNLRLLGAAEAAVTIKSQADGAYRDVVNEVAVAAVKDRDLLSGLTEQLAGDNAGTDVGRRRPEGWSIFLQDVFKAIDHIRSRAPRRRAPRSGA
jgi:transcriptional regulator with XRE-family HTH domain